MSTVEQEITQRRLVLKQRVKKVLALVIVVGALLWAVSPSAQDAKKAGAGSAIPVGAVVASTGDIRVFVDALGTVTSLSSVTVKNQTAGVLTKVAFQEGQLVHEGDFLAEIDPRPYHLAKEQAEGQLARDQALLKDAQLNLDRDKQMIESGAISQQQLDTQAATVLQYEGTVKADEAQVNAAKLNLSYCRITAPVTGRVGLRQVDQGNFVSVAESTGVVTITQMQPITVLFSVPESRLSALLKRKKETSSFDVIALDRDQKEILATGKLSSIDNQIDATTGTIKLRAQFENKEETLYPNAFVNVRLLLDVLKNVVVVPTAAVQRGSTGAYVYLIGADNLVSLRPITLGAVDGDKIAILDGLAVGDKVVTDGADKLREGIKVSLPAEESEKAKDKKDAKAADRKKS